MVVLIFWGETYLRDYNSGNWVPFICNHRSNISNLSASLADEYVLLFLSDIVIEDGPREDHIVLYNVEDREDMVHLMMHRRAR